MLYYGALPVYHYDGGDISKRFEVGEGFLTVKAFGGHAFFQVPLDQSSYFDASSTLAAGSLSYEQGNWRARLSVVYNHSNNEIPLMLAALLRDPRVNGVWPGAASLSSELSIRGKTAYYNMVGLAYDDGTWLAQAEAAYIDSTVSFYPSTASAYLSLGRRFGPVTVYSLFGIAESLRHDVKLSSPALPLPELAALREGVDFAINGNGVDEKSLALGARWDVYENVDVKFEWSHYWLGQQGDQLWDRREFGPVPGNVNVWSVGIDFLF